MICPENRWMWEGVERADSLVLNPHKWMGTGFDLSAYFVRDPEHLMRVMSTDPSYLRTAQDGRVRNLRDWGIPLGRRFRALKLWFLIREYGVEGLQARVRRDLANAAVAHGAGRRGPGLGAPGAGAAADRVRAPRARRRCDGDEPALTAHNLAVADARQPGRPLLPHAVAAQGPPDDPRLHRRAGDRARARRDGVARAAGRRCGGR